MGTATCLSARRLGGMLVAWLVATLITVHEGVLSLRAQDASMKAIFDAIGR